MIRGAGGIALSGFVVCLDDLVGSCIVSGTTAADGSYVIDAPAGSYNVHAYHPDPNGSYVPGYWSAGGYTQFKSSAGVVTVTSADVSGIDITMPLFPFIRGTLTDPDGAPIVGRSVEGALNSSAVTDADGDFAIKVWPNTTSLLRVYWTPVYQGGWYSTGGFVTDQALATEILVGSTDVTGIQFVAPRWPRISGHVTDVNGDPVASLPINFYKSVYDSYQTTTDADGSYVAYLRFGGSWTGQFGSSAPWQIQIVQTNADADIVRDVVMHRLPVISGRILDPHGDPVVGVTINVYGEQNNTATTTTDVAGNFSITWLYMTTPTVFVSFTDPTGTYLSGSLGPTGFQSNGATTYFTLDPDEVLDASVTMPAYVYLTGHVILEGGAPLSGGSVGARTPNATALYAPVGPGGSFSIKVAPGTYSLIVPGGFYGREGFAYESGAVKPFAVGDEGRDIDVVLPAGRTVRGRVTAGTAGIAGVEVDVYLDGTPYTSGTSGPDGTWSIAVPPGAYLVGFYDGSGTHAHGWYGLSGYTSDPLAAKLVGVTTSGVTGINVALPLTRRISGKVVHAESGSGVPYAFVEAFVNDVFYSSQYASSTGAYNLPVAPGKVTLWVFDTDAQVAPGWRTSTGVTANHANAVVTTVGGSNVAGITIRTPEAVILTPVVFWSPAPGSYASVDGRVEAVTYGAAASFDVQDGSGNRYIPLLKGTYRLWVDSNNTAYRLTDGWYTTGGIVSPDFDAAALKTVSGSSSVGITVLAGQVIAGDVHDKDGYALSGIDVQLYANGKFYVEEVAIGGGYSFVVPPGTYRMAFVDLYGLYRTGWLGPAGFVADYASARVLTVTSGSDVGPLTVNLPMDSPPSAPSNVVATPYHQSALVTFTGSAGSLTRPIIHYAVTASPGGRQCITVNTPTCLVTGLVNGTPYSFTVTASSIVGSGSPSLPSVPVTPRPVPDAPRNASAVRSGSSVQVSWSAPANNGSAITGYLAKLSPGGQTCAPSPATSTACTIASVIDGKYVVSITARNAIGTGLPATVPITVDTVAPTVSAPSTTLRYGLSMSGTNVPVSVAWTATDPLAGVADTTLELSVGGGSYANQPLASATATSLLRTLPSSANAYRFRDRAVDASGNLSAWATGPARYIRLRQEAGTGIVYRGSWASASSSTALGGKYRYTSSKGASVTYTFTGRGFSFVSRKRTNAGKAAVYLDGVHLTNIDLYAGTTTVRWVAYAKTYSASKKHVLKIVNLATSGRPRLYVDGFATIR